MKKNNEKLLTVPNGLKYLLSCVPLNNFDSILDLGLGTGFASEFFVRHGKNVSAIGLNIDDYELRQELRDKLELTETSFEDFQTNRKFGAVWFSHCLEHITNPGLALDKINGLLADDGWLFIIVPPQHDTLVLGGHVTAGWNIGQLMYMLALHGFDVRNGHYLKHGYNICAFVQKSDRALPELRMDNGDIEALADFWPKEIEPVNAFEGDVKSINWKWPLPPPDSSLVIFLRRYQVVRKSYRIAKGIKKIVARELKNEV